jgi:hypothetical protein
MATNGLRVGVFLAAAAAAAAMASTGTATPVDTGCPTGFQRLSVASFEAQGPYLLPRHVDNAGNQNGYVCAFALPDSFRDAQCIASGGLGNSCVLQALGLPVYRFVDDDNPAASVG